MKELPSVVNISPPVETDDMQAYMFAWLAATRQLLGGGLPQTKTIASGTFTADEDKTFWIFVDTEGGASTDDLDRLALTNIPDGSLVILQCVNAARVVVVRSAQGGSGQFLNIGGNYSLNDTNKYIAFRRSGTSLLEVGRSWGTDSAGFRAYIGLASAALLANGTADGELPTNLQIFKTVRDYTKQHRFTRTTLVNSGGIAWNLDDNQFAKITLGGNWTLSNPSNKKDGGTYELYVYQDGTGSRTLSYGTDYKWVNGTAPVIGTGANDLTILTFTSDGTYMFGAATGPFPL